MHEFRRALVEAGVLLGVFKDTTGPYVMLPSLVVFGLLKKAGVNPRPDYSSFIVTGWTKEEARKYQLLCVKHGGLIEEMKSLERKAWRKQKKPLP